MPELQLDINEQSWELYAADPLPGWASRLGTLFDTPAATLNNAPHGSEYAVCSIPFDTTESTRAGSRYGPRAIREASLSYSAQLGSRGAMLLRNMRTMQLHNTRTPSLIDFGDLHVYPSDPHKQMAATAAEVYQAARAADRTIILGGEHTLSFPCYSGVAAATAVKTGQRLGYVQIDHHFDFGRTSVLHGPYYQGSNARRISEHKHMSPAMMAFVGVGDLTSAAQYDSLIDSGTCVRPIAAIRERGFEVCLREALDQVAGQAGAVYISIDIDVCDTATAMGTGHVTTGGINATEFLSIAGILQDYPIVALDIMEVAPSFDGGATAHLAARLLFEWIFLEQAP
jgi:agmatinase